MSFGDQLKVNAVPIAPPDMSQRKTKWRASPADPEFLEPFNFCTAQLRV